ncbi:hypothetical protein ABZ725_29535 [Streptomyces sp. NPDC006872]|uniref:hypothetical protein n=1 Tax=Streptomyces sp. NPDC006872 TaxID=3155720 RepID=UPI0033E94A4A
MASDWRHRCLDSGYPSADLITTAPEQGIRMVAPVLQDHSAQAKAAEGFDENALADWTWTCATT